MKGKFLFVFSSYNDANAIQIKTTGETRNVTLACVTLCVTRSPSCVGHRFNTRFTKKVTEQYRWAVSVHTVMSRVSHFGHGTRSQVLPRPTHSSLTSVTEPVISHCALHYAPHILLVVYTFCLASS